jgi:phosphoenolpyruvate carboxykinase (ATP)
VHRTGPFNPAFGAESFGLEDAQGISSNFEAPRRVEEAIQRGAAIVAKGGARSAETRIHTGRSSNEKFNMRAAWSAPADAPRLYMSALTPSKLV